jgi:Transposase IS66 family
MQPPSTPVNFLPASVRFRLDQESGENAIRPTAVGKKNWLFIGEAGAGERSAIIYTVTAPRARSLRLPA